MKPIWAHVDQASMTLMLMRVSITRLATAAVTPPTATSKPWARLGVVEQGRAADQEEAADIDDTRVQQGGHRRGGFHDLNQPAVDRELCALQRTRAGQQHGRDLQAGAEHAPAAAWAAKSSSRRKVS